MNPANAPQHIAADGVPAVWQVGDVVLDLYEVTSKLGEGGMGTVFKVHHRHWNVDLAVKSPRPDAFQTEAQRDTFIREAETWVNLDLHPHLVSCYYVRTLGGTPRVFAEYVAGGSLLDWIRTGKLYRDPQSLARILDVAIQFAWGLHAAHEQGLVHQDVKPANVMMSEDGIVKVTDFGLARALIKAMTPAYCSPEQANGDALTLRTDLWSWAVSVLEFFTGEITWRSGQAAPDALEMYIDTGSEIPGIPMMPAAVATLLRQSFALSPSARPASMLHVAEQLRRAYEDVTQQAYTRTQPLPLVLRSDSLNNRALSMLDLGRGPEALESWHAALAADPHHLESTFNLGLYQWKRGEIDDLTFIKRLQETRTTHNASSRDEYFLSLIHLQRGDLGAVVSLLRQAAWETLQPQEQGHAAVTLGSAFRGLGQDQEAASVWQTVRHLTVEPPSQRPIRKAAHFFNDGILEGHREAVSAVAVSPDGRWVVSGGADRALRLWNAESLTCVATIQGHSGTIRSVAFSPDSRLAVSGSADKTVRVWRVETQECLLVLKGHAQGIDAVTFTTDGKHVLSGSWDRTARMWSIATGDCVGTLEGHEKDVTSLTVAPNGKLIVSGSADKTLRVWDAATRRCLSVLRGHQSEVRAAALSPDGRWLLSTGVDSTIRLWEIETGDCMRVYQGHQKEVRSVAWFSNGPWFISAGVDETLRLWEMDSGCCIRTLEDSGSPILALSLGAGGERAVSAHKDGRLRRWQVGPVRHPEEDWVLCSPQSAGERAVVETQARELLNTAARKIGTGEFRAAYDAIHQAQQLPGCERLEEARPLLQRLSLHGRRIGLREAWMRHSWQAHKGVIYSIAISPDGCCGISGGSDSAVQVWDLPSGKFLRTFRSHKGSACSVAISPDGQRCVSSDIDNSAHVWDLRSCASLHVQQLLGAPAVVFSPDGNDVLSGGFLDVELWNASNGNRIMEFREKAGNVKSIAISDDGKYILAGYDDALTLFDKETGRNLRTLDRRQTPAVAFSRDSRMALSSSAQQMRLWDIHSGECIHTLVGHTGEVSSLGFVKTGRWILSGSRDKTIRVWDSESGQCIRTLQGHTDPVNIVTFSDDGRWALSGGDEGTLRLWEFDWDLEFPGQ